MAWVDMIDTRIPALTGYWFISRVRVCVMFKATV